MAAADGNAEQIDYWNGEVGERWVRRQAELDRVFAPLTVALLDRAGARPGERVLDVGCGCGDTALALAERVGGGGRVLAVDVSRPMLEQARRREAESGGTGRAPIEWVEADAAAHPFEEGSVDLVASRFGVMFFADPAAAFANIRRALKVGGRLAMLCWDRRELNGWVSVPLEGVLRVVPPPEPVPPGTPGPFAFADAERVGRILGEAGFAEVGSEAVAADLLVGEGPAEGAAERAATFLLGVGPVSGLLREVDEATRAAARAEVLETLRPLAREDGLRLGARCLLYTAVNSG